MFPFGLKIKQTCIFVGFDWSTIFWYTLHHDQPTIIHIDIYYLKQILDIIQKLFYYTTFKSYTYEYLTHMLEAQSSWNWNTLYSLWFCLTASKLCNMGICYSGRTFICKSVQFTLFRADSIVFLLCFSFTLTYFGVNLNRSCYVNLDYRVVNQSYLFSYLNCSGYFTVFSNW